MCAVMVVPASRAEGAFQAAIFVILCLLLLRRGSIDVVFARRRRWSWRLRVRA